MRVGPPATRTDEYLAAILEELRELRWLLEDGRQDKPDRPPVATVEAPLLDGGDAITGPPRPAKRTRQRTRTPA